MESYKSCVLNKTGSSLLEYLVQQYCVYFLLTKSFVLRPHPIRISNWVYGCETKIIVENMSLDDLQNVQSIENLIWHRCVVFSAPLLPNLKHFIYRDGVIGLHVLNQFKFMCLQNKLFQNKCSAILSRGNLKRNNVAITTPMPLHRFLHRFGRYGSNWVGELTLSATGIYGRIQRDNEEIVTKHTFRTSEYATPEYGLFEFFAWKYSLMHALLGNFSSINFCARLPDILQTHVVQHVSHIEMLYKLFRDPIGFYINCNDTNAFKTCADFAIVDYDNEIKENVIYIMKK